MQERRAKLLAMEFPEFKAEVLDHIEHVAGLKADAMGEKIGAQCKQSVEGVMFAIQSWTVSQEQAMKEIGENSKAAAEGSLANGLAIKELADSLSVTIAVEDVAQKSASFLGAVKNKLHAFSVWLKDSLTGIAAILFIIGLASGTIKVDNLLDFFFKAQ